MWTMTRAQPVRSAYLAVDAPIVSALSNCHVVLTGGTGLIGHALVKRLLKANAQVTLLTRNPGTAMERLPAGARAVALMYDAAVDEALPAAVSDSLGRADVVINLAGEPIESSRWTASRKRVLRDSRIIGTRKIVNALALAAKPAVLVSASAVGYYGMSESDTFTEDGANGNDFLATISSAWEQAALVNSATSRTVVLRFGVVLSRSGGALGKMKPAFRAFLGGAPGSGQQWFSWVHIDDLVRLILHAAMQDKWDGVYNATAPQPVRLEHFCKQLGRVLTRPSWLPVPKQAVRMLLGSEAAQLVLAGQHVLPKRTRANGFVYQYKDVGSALDNLIQENQ